MTLTENTIEDYYGYKEYVDKDSYAHFHKSGLHNHGTVFLVSNTRDEMNITKFGTNSYGTPVKFG